jgi:hypothetical protein
MLSTLRKASSSALLHAIGTASGRLMGEDLPDLAVYLLFVFLLCCASPWPTFRVRDRALTPREDELAVAVELLSSASLQGQRIKHTQVGGEACAEAAALLLISPTGVPEPLPLWTWMAGIARPPSHARTTRLAFLSPHGTKSTVMTSQPTRWTAPADHRMCAAVRGKASDGSTAKHMLSRSPVRISPTPLPCPTRLAT